MSLPLPLRGKIRIDRRDESLFLFLEILPGEFRTFTAREVHTFAPGSSVRPLSGRSQFFPILTFKGSLPGISKFYSSWKLRFRFPVISSAFQKFTKKLAAGNFHFFPNFTAAGKPMQSRKRKKIFLKKGLTKIKKCGILKLEKMRKGKCGNGKI